MRAGSTAVIHHEEDVMGTIVTFDVRLSDSANTPAVDERMHSAISDLHHIDTLLSTWNPYSPISRLRRGELASEEVPRELRDVLDTCRALREVSWGWFDPWALPGGVDPTGYVKGWAAQRACHLVMGDGVERVIVNAAGDVAVGHAPTDQAAVRIGIVNPFDRQLVAFVVDVERALATSGTYERGEHIISPATGAAASAVASASVSGPDLGWADALATALCAGGRDALGAVDDLDGYAALVIDHDGSVYMTPGFPLSTADAT